MENKKRLIDANALIKKEKPMESITHGMVMAVQSERILEAPTVDAVEVVHGRWLEDQVEAFSPFGGDAYLLDVLQCSVCGEYFDVSEARNYCPNCGAKMDGGNEDG